MSLTYWGAQEFSNDITTMADALRDSGGNGKSTVTYILQKAATPIHAKMLENASSHPTPRSGALKRSIKIGRVIRSAAGRYRVRIGVFAGSEAGEYGKYVEFGHGGKHGPAAPHPYVRPAFDAKVNEAYEQMKQELATALAARGL